MMDYSAMIYHLKKPNLPTLLEKIAQSSEM